MGVEIVNSHVLRGMAYLALVVDGGESLSDIEIDDFASTPCHSLRKEELS